ncbi:hypothetical protein D046_4100B, partial [Vibrio parahaemolyticus V-223/04]
GQRITRCERGAIGDPQQTGITARRIFSPQPNLCAVPIFAT